MSEFLAEARILVRPDTAGFRAEMLAQLKSVSSTAIKVPVVPIVGAGFAAATAGSAAFAAAQGEAAASTAVTSEALAAATRIAAQYTGVVDLAAVSVQTLAATQEKEAITATQAAAAQAAHVRSVSGLSRGAGASALTLFGLRGATLAASGAFLAGTAAVVGFSKALQSAAALQTQLNVFKVTASATADEMARVSAEAKQLGRDLTLPGVTASDAATALTELSKAGLSVRDSMAAARGTLQLATAAQISNADAAKLVSSALNSFQLDGSQAVKVADLFAGAAANAQGSIQDFGPALGQASAVANAFGVSIGDTVTLLTQLAKAGLEGGRAGTSLRVAFLRLVNPPAEAAKTLKELNIQVRDVNGNLRPQVFTDIEEALKGVSVAQRQATEAIIFGSDAVRTQVILGKAGADAFDQISAAVNKSGLAQEQAAARTQGLQGDFENLQNQVSALGLTLGEVATGPTSTFVKQLANLAADMNTTADAAVALAQEIGHLKDSVAGAVPGLGFLGDNLGKIATVGKFINPATRSFALAALAAKQFGVDTEDTGKKVSVFDGIAASVTKTLNGLAQSLAGVASAMKQEQPASGKGFNVAQIQNIVEGFDAKGTRDKIAKNTKQLLADLNSERDFLIAQLKRDYVKNRPALKRALEQALLGANNEIDQILKQGQGEKEKTRQAAEKAARDAAAAANARDQALLSGQSLARDRRQNQIEAAAQTAGVKDDIAQERILRALVLKQIESVKARVTDETARKAALVALNGILVSVNGTIKTLIAQQAQNRADQRQELLQGIDLDIELADITGNQAAEVAARNRKIAELNKDLAAEKKLHGTSTVLYKEIAVEIARQNEAKKQIQAEAQKGQSFAQATFEFLQTQQGFASNLLGNLIPTGATGGLVGGGSVQGALTPVAGAADGQAKAGPTAGQAQTTNSILHGILQQLKILNGDNTAPEAQRQNRGQRAVMDGVGGG